MNSSSFWLLLSGVNTVTLGYNMSNGNYTLAAVSAVICLWCVGMTLLYSHEEIRGERKPAQPVVGPMGATGADGQCKCACASKKQILLG